MWLIAALQIVLMLGAGVLYPAFQQPDEAAHIDYVLAHRDGVWWDGPGQRQYQSGVLAASDLVPDIQAGMHVGEKAPLPRTDRKSFDALGTGPANTAVTNQMVQHPPLYYGLAAGFTFLLPDFSHRSFDVQVFWLRLFSLLLMLPVPFLVFSAARRISGNVDLALVAALLPLSIPSYLRIGASVTNDSLLVLTMTALLALLARVIWADTSLRTASLAGVMWGAALLTKGFALAMPPAIVVAYLLATEGALPARIRRIWRPLVLCGTIGSAIGAWWWIRNVIIYSAVQPDGYGPLPENVRVEFFGASTPRGTEVGLFYNFFKTLGVRLWGSLGLIDIPSPPAVGLFGTSIVFVVLIVLALGRRDGAPGWRTSRGAALVLPVILTIAIMFYGARSSYLHGTRLPGIQTRYLVPDVLGLTVCAALGLKRCFGRHFRWVPPVILTSALVYLSYSTYLVLTIEMSPDKPGALSRLEGGARYVSGWAPWSSAVTVVVGALIAGVWLLTLATFWRHAATENLRTRAEPGS